MIGRHWNESCGEFIEELRQGDRNEFPDLDPKVQVPFVRLVLEECGKGRELNEAQRTAALAATLDMVERIPPRDPQSRLLEE